MTLAHTITAEDVGKGVIQMECPCCGSQKPLYLHGLMGRIQRSDVGKRIYRSDAGVLSVESDQQLATRRAFVYGSEPVGKAYDDERRL